MKFYARSLKAWAPGVTTAEEWLKWSRGELTILNEKLSPKLEFTDAMFRRRFSQITKMTIQVIHDVVEECPAARDYRIIFSSFRGEIEREFAIDRMIIEEKMILPAAFSLSVFNTPVAAASIALGMKKGYSCIYPSKGNFRDVLLGTLAPIFCGDEKEVLLVYADEKIPEEYKDTLKNYRVPGELQPLSFACILSSAKTQNSVELDTDVMDASPESFLKNFFSGMTE